MSLLLIHKRRNKNRLWNFLLLLNKVWRFNFLFRYAICRISFLFGLLHFNGQIFDPPFEFSISKAKKKTVFNVTQVFLISMSVLQVRIIFLECQKNETIQIFFLLLLGDQTVWHSMVACVPFFLFFSHSFYFHKKAPTEKFMRFFFFSSLQLHHNDRKSNMKAFKYHLDIM